MARFDRQIKTAQRLIAKNGQTVTYKKTTSIENPAAPWETSIIEVEHFPKICFLPVDLVNKESYTLQKGREVPGGATLAYMGAVNFNVELGDLIIRNGVQFRIDYIDVLNPNGQIILYTMVLIQ